MDCGVDPANLGRGDWVYYVSACVNQMGGNVPSVHDIPSFMQFEKSQGIEYIMVKAGTGSTNFNGGGSSPQFNSNLVYQAHAAGLKIFAYTRSYGSDVPGEIALAINCLNLGADGFVIDAEAEWESYNSWIGSNGPTLATQLCTGIKNVFPNRFLGHSPLPMISLHSSFPYKEFGRYCDAVMPQVYWQSLRTTPASAVYDMDVEWAAWQNSLTGVWTNAIKPIVPAGQGWSVADPITATDISNFVYAVKYDTNPVTAGGYKGVNYWRADEHTAEMWEGIRNSVIGDPAQAPSISVQPCDTTAIQGSSVSFSVRATGTALLSYQWKVNGSNIGSATNSTYSLQNVQSANQGSYSVVVSNRAGSLTSTAAVLTVSSTPIAPSFVVPLQAQTVTLGQTAVFAAMANGTGPMSYQWKANGVNVSGATNAWLTLTNVQSSDAKSYSVVVSNPSGSATSQSALLTVDYALKIKTTGSGTVSIVPNQSTFASNAAVKLVALAGPDFVFSSWSGDASGASNPLTVNMTASKTIIANFSRIVPEIVVDNPAATFTGTWSTDTFKKSKYGSSDRYATETAGSATATAEYRPNIAVAGNYDVYIWYPFGSTATRNAQVFVSCNGGSRTAAIDQYWNWGGWVCVASNVNFATGTNGYVRISNNTGSADERLVYADAVRLVYTTGQSSTPPVISDSPVNATQNAYSTATFTVSAVGTAPLSYQWKRNGVNLSNGADISGATSPTLTLANVLGDDSGSYTVYVSNAGGSATSSAAILTVLDPLISQQPFSRTNYMGTTATMSVSALGSSPLTYRWKKNGVAIYDGGNISGAGTAYLTIGNIVSGDQASYSVVVSNSFGGVTSVSAYLTVTTAPVIYSAPVSRTNSAGTIATFSVGAYGQNLVYQWRKNDVPLSNGGNVVGANTATLSLTDVSHADSASYAVSITNPSGAALSTPASLTVINPPAIQAQPQGQTVIAGQSAIFSVTATGDDLSYQWRFQGSNISGQTGSSLSLPSAQLSNAGSYSVVISNFAGALTSADAVLAVNFALNVTVTGSGTVEKNPDQASYAAGTVVTLTAVPAPGYTFTGWSGDAEGTDNPIIVDMTGNKNVSAVFANATSAIIVDDADPGFSVSGSWLSGSSASDKYGASYRYSSVASISGNKWARFTPEIAVTGYYDVYVWHPAGGNRSSDVPWTVVYNGGATTATVNQQVQGGKWLKIASTKRFVAGTSGYVQVSNNASPTNVMADAVKFVFSDLQSAPVISSQPESRTVNPGQTVLFAVSASGGTLTYQWHKNAVPLANGGSVSGVDTATLTMANVSQSDAGDYSVVVSNLVGPTTSEVANLSFAQMPVITAQPISSQTNNAGGSAFFTVAASGTEPLTFQWRRNGLVLSDTENISGARTPSLTVSSLLGADAGTYVVSVSNGAGAVASSNSVLRVIDPIIIAHPESRTNGPGTIATFSVTVVGTGPLDYQWQKDGVNLADGGNILGANSETLTIDPVEATDGGDYRVLVMNESGTAASLNATLSLFELPQITSNPSGVAVSSGNNAVFTVAASGSSLSYQWRKGDVDLVDGGNISGATTTSLTVANVSQADIGDYVAVVTNPGGSVFSQAATLTLADLPLITAGPTSRTNVYGSTTIFSVSAAGTGLSYQWQKEQTALVNSANVLGANTAQLTLRGLVGANEGAYSVIVSNYAGSVTSQVASLTVTVIPTFTLQPSSQTVVVGASTTFSALATGGGVSYQWRKNGIAISDGNGISGTKTAELSIENVTTNHAGLYTVVAANLSGSKISAGAVLTVWAGPAITRDPASRTNVAGTTATFSVGCSGTAPLSYQWYREGVPVVNSGMILGATSSTLTLLGVNLASAGNYSVKVSNMVSEVTSSSARLTILVAPTISLQPLSCTTNAGSNAVFSVVASGGNLSYQWKRGAGDLADGGNVIGAKSPTLSLQAVTPSDAGNYTVVVTNAAGSISSSAAMLTVLSAPWIIQQPADASSLYNSMVALRVTAGGTAPLTYQWRKSGVPLSNNGRISGVTTANLSITGLSTNDMGAYSVVISNAFGSVTSSNAVIRVIPLVSVTSPGSGSFNSSSLLVKGAASDASGPVTQVLYSFNGGSFQLASGTLSWTAPISLSPGSNTFVVKSVNSFGNESLPVKRSYFFNVYSPLTLLSNGLGYVTGAANGQNLLIGKPYKLTARPGAGQILSNWTGSVSSSNIVLSFIMQSNMVIQANFVPNPFLPRAGAYNGLFFETNAVNHERSGFIYVKMTTAGVYSGRINLAGVNRSLKGKFAPGGESQVILTSTPPLVIDLNLDVATQSGELRGVVAGTNWVAPFLADRAAGFFNLPVTNYTVTLLGDGNGSMVPGGDGFANLTLRTNSSVIFKGRLPDDTAFSMATTYASRRGDFPVYIPLFKTNGSLLGWLTNGPGNVYQGTLNWIKKPTIGTNYVQGFTNELSALSSRFYPLTSVTRPLSLTNALVILSDGSLSAPITNSVVLTNSSVIGIVAGQTNGMALKVTTTTGQITGSFINPLTGKKTSIKGILLQDQNEARGYVLTPETGYFLLGQE